MLNLCNSKIKKCFWNFCTFKSIRIVKYLEKIQVRKMCWFCEILKSSNFKVCTHKGIGKMLKKIQVREKCWFCEIQKFRKVLNLCNSKIKKCFGKVCTYKCIRIVEYLEKIQVRKKCWFCEIHKLEKKVLILWNCKIKKF